MALEFMNAIGFGSGGLEEADSTSGTPSVERLLSTGGIIPRTGSFYLEIVGSSDEYTIAEVVGQGATDQGNDKLVGFAVQFPDTTPASDTIFFRAEDDGYRTIWTLTLQSNGNLKFTDNASASNWATTPFTDDEWHFVELYWEEHASTASVALYIDGDLKFSVVNKDMYNLSDHAFYTFLADTAITVYFDDFYCATGATAQSELLGPRAEVLGMYQHNTHLDDDGDALPSMKNWYFAGDTPYDVASSEDWEPGYISTEAKSGGVTCDNAEGQLGIGTNMRAGPGKVLTGTAYLAKWIHYLKRDGGGGTTHYQRCGKNTVYNDVGVTITTGWVQYVYLTDTTTYMPNTSGDWFSQGVGKLTGGQIIICQEMWSSLLHVRPLASALDLSDMGMGDEDIPNPGIRFKNFRLGPFGT